MGMISWIALGLVAGLLAVILLLAYLLVTSWTTRTGRHGPGHRHGHRSYGSGTSALVRAEKRLYQDWRPSADPASRPPVS